MNNLIIRYYGILRLFLKLYGLTPDLQPSQKLITTIFVNFNIWTLLILQMLTFVTMEYNAENLIEVFGYLIPSISIAVSYYTVYLRQRQMWQFLREVDRDCERVDVGEMKIIAKYANEWMLYTKMLTASCFIFCLMMFNVPMLLVVLDIVVPSDKTRTRQLPVLIECFIDQEKYYYEIFFFLYFLIIENVALMVIVFATFLLFVQHARSSFNIVGYILENMFNHVSSNRYKNRRAMIYESVVRSIKFHKRAISYVEKINSFGENTYLINMALGILLAGVSFIKMFCLDSTFNDTMKLIFSIFYALGTFTWIYISCYIGQQLLDESEGVFEKICQVPWYLTSRETQQLSLIMMQRSIRPSYMSIGKIFVASHELFSSIMQTAISYATVYYSIQ